MRTAAVWGFLAVAIVLTVAVAAASPYLAWRSPVYIAAGFAGVAALVLLLIQPLLAAGYLPGFAARRGRNLHRRLGILLIACILAHVIGLWITSPPDAIDALLFASPTPFSPWGVVAMWAAFGAAALAGLRTRLHLRPVVWRIGHTVFVLVVAVGSVVHALLVEGAMGTLTKTAFCILVLAATAKAILDLRVWTMLKRRRA